MNHFIDVDFGDFRQETTALLTGMLGQLSKIRSRRTNPLNPMEGKPRPAVCKNYEQCLTKQTGCRFATFTQLEQYQKDETREPRNER